MVKVKICGLKRLEDIELVNKYNPDYIGFVFADSKRKVSHDLASKMKDELNSGIVSVGVFVNASQDEILDLYFRQCSIEATAKDLAMFGSVLANDGRAPWNGERLISRENCRIVKTIMVTCGMYDASGEFAVSIGIPAKSGVGGGILGTVPRWAGIGVYGPCLDKKGNSFAGTKLLRDLSEELDLSIF